MDVLPLNSDKSMEMESEEMHLFSAENCVSLEVQRHHSGRAQDRPEALSHGWLSIDFTLK